MAPMAVHTPRSTTRSSASPRLPTLSSFLSADTAFVTTCRGPTPGPLKRKVSKEVRFAFGSESTGQTPRAKNLRGPDMSTMCAPRRTHPKTGYISPAMRGSIVQTSNLCTSALIKQAHELIDPQRRRYHTRYNSVERRDGFTMYETVNYSNIGEGEEDEGEACVDDNVVLLQDSAQSFAALDGQEDNTPRIRGTTQVQATLEEFISTFAGRSNRGAVQQLLNQGMASSDHVYSLLDEKNKRISVKWMVLEPKAAGAMARRRDFVVVECQKRFQLHDGRRGWVQSLQSIDFPWYPPHETDAGFVRGMIHQTGLVAIESLDGDHSVDVVVAAQVALKGNSSSGAQRAVSRRRVVKTLQSLGVAIETDRVERMSYLGTQRFVKVELDQKERRCKICSDRVGLLGMKPRHSCRKCGGSVCGGCSQVWQIERTRSTTVVGGGRVSTRTRVCTECLVLARQRDQASSPRESDECHVDDHRQSTNMLATTLPLPRMSEEGTTRALNHSVFASGKALESIMPMRPTQLEFSMKSHHNLSPIGSMLGDSDVTTDDEDDQPGSPFEQSPRDRMEVVRPVMLNLDDLAI